MFNRIKKAMKTINTEQICEIYVHTKRTDTDYCYKKQKKFLGIIYQKEGFYKKMFFSDDIYVTVQDIKESGKRYVEGTKVYYKPYLIMVMSNGNHIYKYFEFVSTLTDYLKSDLLKDVKFIEV